MTARHASLLAAATFMAWATFAGAQPAASPTSRPATQPATALTLQREDEPAITLTLEQLAKLPHETVDVTDHDGTAAKYSGVPLDRVLEEIDTPLGPQLRGEAMSLYVVAEARDGYKVTFGLAEIDRDFGDRHILIADARNGQPLAEKDGPLRLVVPQDTRQGRWVRMLAAISVRRAD